LENENETFVCYRAQQICEKLSETPLIRVGFFHKGSRQRMNEEMRLLSIRDLQMCKYSLSLDTFAHVRYFCFRIAFILCLGSLQRTME
jgi:hypothetical protein